MTQRQPEYATLMRRIAELAALPPADNLATRDAETRHAFRQWSRGYDVRNTTEAYLAPAILTDLACRYLVPGVGPILDLACGTGLLGASLHAAGFTDLLGLDLSEDMLARAAEKAVYRQLLPANLHAPLPVDFQSMAAITCCGAFYAGSVEVVALAHALPLIRPGGHFICDIEMEAWQDGGYGRVLQSLAAEGALDLLHCQPIRMFRPGVQSDDDPLAPQGMALVARIAKPLSRGEDLP